MLRRTLLKVPSVVEPPQRKSLFKTTYRSHGKICRVIVDSGSTEDVVSIEMVDNLDLKRVPHTTPYKMSWLNKGQQIVVNEQKFVEFEIGEYKKKVLCDMMPMDSFHLLLGCPWKYDVKAIHDGEKNRYVITKQGKKFQMDPLTKLKEEKHVRTSVILLSGNEFLKAMKKEKGVCCPVVVRPREETKEKVHAPQEVQKLLEKYHEIVDNGLPSGLEPMREVTHQIDLIPGENIPNKVAYKMTPSQNTEIAK